MRALTGARKGLFAKSPFGREIAIDWVCGARRGNFCSLAFADVAASYAASTCWLSAHCQVVDDLPERDARRIGSSPTAAVAGCLWTTKKRPRHPEWFARSLGPLNLVMLRGWLWTKNFRRNEFD